MFADFLAAFFLVAFFLVAFLPLDFPGVTASPTGWLSGAASASAATSSAISSEALTTGDDAASATSSPLTLSLTTAPASLGLAALPSASPPSTETLFLEAFMPDRGALFSLSVASPLADLRSSAACCSLSSRCLSPSSRACRMRARSRVLWISRSWLARSLISLRRVSTDGPLLFSFLPNSLEKKPGFSTASI